MFTGFSPQRKGIPQQTENLDSQDRSYENIAIICI